MSVRKIRPQTQASRFANDIRPTLRTNNRVAAYARQSDPKAPIKNVQSKEMQTIDLMKWCLEQGWAADLLDPYHADLGLSGTLRPDQRPDMLRLFDSIDKGLYDRGSVVCYQESRLFRDETQIYYNQFIQKCKDHDIVVIVVSPYTMLYDFRDDFLTEMFRWKCKEAAEFIRRQVKGWMLPARERAAMRGLWAGYGDLPMGYIVDFDSHSVNYKKFVPYEPHAVVVRWLFDRYMQLGGDLGKLCRELIHKPVYFPVFNEDLDPRNISKRKLKLDAAGYRIRTRTAVESILTNPHYIGAWTVKGILVRYNNHEPIVARDVFDFSFNRLSAQTLDGEQKEVVRQAKRYYQQATLLSPSDKSALLKDRISSKSGSVYARIESHEGVRYCIYAITPKDPETFFTYKGTIGIGRVERIDDIVVKRLFERIHKIGNLEQYELLRARQNEEKKKQLNSIEDSIKQIGQEQKNLVLKISKTDNDKLHALLDEQFQFLEIELQKLLIARDQLNQEINNVLKELEEELKDLEDNWPRYPFERRVTLMNFLVKNVVIDVVAPHWTRIEVQWLHNDWGAEYLYLWGTNRGHMIWTEEENAILVERYSTLPKLELMKCLPTRTWNAIHRRAKVLRLRRPQGGGGKKLSAGDKDLNFSYDDREFMEKANIAPTCPITNWEPLYQPA